MNWDIVAGHWDQYEVEVRARWDKLTDANLDVIAGERTKLAGKLQEAYGFSEDEAEEQIKRFEDSYQAKPS